MSRQQPSDRLAAILAELDEGRRTPWLPEEDDVVDRRPLWRRRPRGAPHGDGLSALGFGTQDDAPARDDIHDEEPSTRSERRARGPARQGSSASLRPHTPLFRTPLPDTEIETHPGRSALVGALVVLVVVAIVFGFRVWSARTSAEPVPLAASTNSESSSAGASPNMRRDSLTRAGNEPAASASPAHNAQGATTVLVHVVGQVRKPGVVTLPNGARVGDAIRAAGGASAGANLDSINLARPVGDGEQVHVPRPGETPSVAASSAPQATHARSAASAAGPVDLNSADEGELDSLPGVGPVLASRIVQWRTTNGRFTSVDDLGEVTGIGDKLLSQLRPLVTV